MHRMHGYGRSRRAPPVTSVAATVCFLITERAFSRRSGELVFMPHNGR
jgi:hypothetical protein